MNKKIRNKQIAALILLAALACRIFLPGKYANAVPAPHQYSGCSIKFVSGRPDLVYFEGNFSSLTRKKFEAHFFAYVNNNLHSYTHQTCSGGYQYYLNSSPFTINQPCNASGYTTK